MIQIGNNFGNEDFLRGHARLYDYCDMANLYFNFVGKNIETSNECVIMSSEKLAFLIREAFITGWQSNDEYEHSPNKFLPYTKEDKRACIPWRELEHALDKKKKTSVRSFVYTVYRTPFLTKEYAMKNYGLTEEEWSQLPQSTKDYYSQEYYYKDVPSQEDINKD
jgi:hypothetical protein